MPTFDLKTVVPGLEIVSPDPLDLSATPTEIQIRLVDALLWMPEGQTITIAARHDAAASQVVLEGTFSPNPILFIGDQLKLDSLTLSISVTASGGFDSAAATPVAATGALAWESDIVGQLGIADNRLPFALGYEQGSGASGFTLNLVASSANPIALPRVFAEIETGRIRIDVMPVERAIRLALKGEARLDVSSGMIGQAKTMLSQVFGADTVANLTDPPPFEFAQTYRLEDTGLPGLALDMPSFSIFPDWSSGTPEPDTPDGITVAPGRPRFRFTLPDLSTPVPDLDFSLRNASLRLPDLPGFEGFDLSGHLDYQSAASGWSLLFTPTMGGTLPLPDILDFFLAQFGWLQGALPDLDDLEDLARLSQVELDWFRQFEALLNGVDRANPDPGFVAAFPGLFGAILDAAFALPGAPAPERLFRLAFRAFAEIPELFGPIWDAWFARLGTDWPKLLDLIEAVMTDLPAPRLAGIFDRLFAAGALDPEPFLRAALAAGANRGPSAPFLKLWIQTLAAAIRALDPAVLGTTLLTILKTPSVPLASFRTLPEIAPVSLGAALPSEPLRLDIALVSLGLNGILAGTTNLGAMLSFSDTARLFDHVSKPFRDLLEGTIWPEWPRLDAELVLPLISAFLAGGTDDHETEALIIQVGRIFPLGIVMALTQAALNALRNRVDLTHDPHRWDHMLFRSIEEEPGLATLRLPPPGPAAGGKPATKYIIFSDIHREQIDDDTGPLNFGSIDHFLGHADMYLELLNWADAEGYTVLEDGDGEELWFIRAFETWDGPADTLQAIIDTHKPVYDKLADMHARGRYFRLFGNHDSQIRDPAVFAVMAAQFPATIRADHPEPGLRGLPFRLYDHVIIEDVKTMDDGVLDIVFDALAANTMEERIAAVRSRLIQQTLGRIGLDSGVYTNRKPLVVTHGHQWDFWNCDANALVGKLLANCVGVPVDKTLDPFKDVGGLHGSGKISVNFADILAQLPVASNFVAHAPARRMVHEVQHMSDADRMLIDDVFYWETLTALTSWLAMPLSAREDDGSLRTWSEFLANPTPTGIFDHILNQIAIGHTHYPQARPYIDIEGLLFGPLADIADTIRDAMAEHLFGLSPSLNVVQVPYYNSGTSGWFEGVVWALKIDEDAVTRLVYWTKDTKPSAPQEMDWQVPAMDPAMRAALDTRIDALESYLDQMPDLFGDAFTELMQNLETVAKVSAGALIAFADEIAEHAVSIQPSETVPGAVDPLVHVRQQSNEIGQWLLQLFLATLQRRIDPGAIAPTTSLTVELPTEVADRLAEAETMLAALPVPNTPARGRTLTALACVWLLGNRSASAASRARNLDLGDLMDADYPVVWLVFALIAILPLGDNPALPFSADVERSGRTLTLTVAVR